MNQKIFHKYCESALRVLRSQYETTKVLNHPGALGSIREQIIKNFLGEHLPRSVEVSSGIIFDADGQSSRQQDVVLVSRNMPRLPFPSGNDLIFVEGVVSTIEVKSQLNKNALIKIGENINSVRALKKSFEKSFPTAAPAKWGWKNVLSAVVTYDGLNFDGQLRNLSELNELGIPDLLLDLKKGLLIVNNGSLLDKDGDDQFLVVDDATNGFELFLTFLTEVSSIQVSHTVGWRKYW